MEITINSSSVKEKAGKFREKMTNLENQPGDLRIVVGHSSHRAMTPFQRSRFLGNILGLLGRGDFLSLSLCLR